MEDLSLSLTTNSQGLTPQEQARWRACCELAKQKMRGTEEEKQAILQKRILRFSQNYKLNQSSYYVPRKDIQQNQLTSTIINYSVLIIFGIDFLSPNKIGSYFAPYNIQSIILDQSHCAVRFQSSKTLLQAFYMRLLQKPQSVEALQNFFIGNQYELIKWREIQGYSEMEIERKLWARFAIEKQLEVTQKIDQYKFDSMNAAKRMFIKSFQRQQRNQKKGQKLEYGFQKTFREMQRKKDKFENCCCHIRYNKIVEAMKCNCRKKRSPESRDKFSERERTREKHKQRNHREYKGLENLGKPLDIIKQITQPNHYKMSVQSLTNNSNKFQTPSTHSFSCGIPKISSNELSSETELNTSLTDMINEMQRHKLFDEGDSQLESEQFQPNRGSMNKSQYSIFEADKSDDD